jgi:hypothetical protein
MKMNEFGIDALSNVERSRITDFVRKERRDHPDWFVVSSAKNFASPADLMLYFSAFCLALQNANKGLTEIDKILRKVKSIFSTWKSLVSEKQETNRKSTVVRLNIEEKVIVVIYRSICSGTGGARKEDVAQHLGILPAKADRILRQLLKKGVLSHNQQTEQWSLSVA